MPVVTVALAAGVLAEHLTPIQIAGGVLVLTAVLVLRVVPRHQLAHEHT
jgi:drug/metabolite transporter (DMT)-like permease